MYVCMQACVHVALRKDFAIVLQHCEKVMQLFSRITRGAILQWFVPDVPNIAETLIFSIARGVRNCFAALQKGVAMVLLHCGGFLQWLCFAALRGVLAMPLLRFLIAKGCHKGFAALRGVSAMAPKTGTTRHSSQVALVEAAALARWAREANPEGKMSPRYHNPLEPPKNPLLNTKVSERNQFVHQYVRNNSSTTRELRNVFQSQLQAKVA